MQATNIGWTDFSDNLLKYRDPDENVVHACVRISEGCRNCYASALAGRWGRKGKDFTAQNMKPLTPFFDLEGARRLLTSRKISGKRVFISDMTDLFGEWVSDEIIDQHFAIFAMRPDVTFQVLTKRAKRMNAYLSRHDVGLRWAMQIPDTQLPDAAIAVGWSNNGLPNVHLGVSVEDQTNANQRLPWLLESPAAVRWASVEPLIGAVDLEQVVIAYFKNERIGADYISTRNPHNANATVMGAIDALTGRAKGRVEFDEKMQFTGQTVGRLDGIVIGGESGAGHREMPLTEALVLAESARAAGVSVYVKQDSGPRPGMKGRIPDDVWAMKEWPTAA
jgi:protein gp37